jgi:ABC-type glycerol-3-phosphate transport system substrate-binding protein
MKLRKAALVLVVGILLAGCGGGPRHPAPTYVTKVDAVASGLDSVTNDLYTPTDPSSAAAELSTVQAALRKAAAQLEAITPPGAVKADHARLIDALDELASGVGPLIAELKSGSVDSVGAPLSLKGVADARTAIAALNAAGYKIRFPLLG